MSIEKITDRILSEAKAEAGRTLDKAEREKNAVLEKARLQADMIRQDARDRAEQDAILMKERKISVAELEARKLRLAAKQKAIETSFGKTLERLEGMDSSAYMELMLASLKKAGAAGELLLNLRDRERLGEQLVERTNGITATGSKDAQATAGGGMILSSDVISARGGFILRKGSMELNSTLEVMVGDVTEEMTPEVVRILFGDLSDRTASS